MGAYLVRRLLGFIPTIFVVAVLVFLMIYFIPGDPAVMLLGMDASGEALREKRVELGLDRPLVERFGIWITHAIRGDLGESYFLGEPVTKSLVDRMPVTLSLAVLSMILATSLGVVAGIAAAIHQGRAGDWGVMLAALLGLSVPTFWLGLNLIFLLAVALPWFPVGQYVALSEDPVEYVRHLILPVLSLGLPTAAVIARMTRASMLDVLGTDYIRTARAKGLRQRTVIYGHALKNALIPIITIIGLSAGALLGGTVITETVFNLPGVGRLVVEAVKRRDYYLVQGSILAVTCSYLLVNLVVDLIYTWANPRIRYD